ncbi:hypothetical protein C4N20_15635 [Fusobacterium ulcerans]|uniref:Phage tail protein n=1 Tax=Fusobacterium ulcerans TaxID=861 RepID=A0AAX2JAM8_9FUSO|nr:tail protein X [Fusobacterium ulcerans]AVQ29463.1 hypothetical protein C4N20_15635 [Fusobacterium ulcerans]EFS27040.1 hypothetical protein FUAG_02555 [Fusobacterium ulcerans ATCC 49185]SQJ03943.1 Uncharacterised protein [Fusobacterium ulcerans]
MEEDKIYTTISGDTWDSISYKIFGDSKAYNTLFELNQEFIGTVIFEAGKNIKYRDIPKTYDETVPPWRR